MSWDSLELLMCTIFVWEVRGVYQYQHRLRTNSSHLSLRLGDSLNKKLRFCASPITPSPPTTTTTTNGLPEELFVCAQIHSNADLLFWPWIYTFTISQEIDVNFVARLSAHNWLHFNTLSWSWSETIGSGARTNLQIPTISTTTPNSSAAIIINVSTRYLKSKSTICMFWALHPSILSSNTVYWPSFVDVFYQSYFDSESFYHLYYRIERIRLLLRDKLRAQFHIQSRQTDRWKGSSQTTHM